MPQVAKPRNGQVTQKTSVSNIMPLEPPPHYVGNRTGIPVLNANAPAYVRNHNLKQQTKQKQGDDNAPD